MSKRCWSPREALGKDAINFDGVYLDAKGEFRINANRRDLTEAEKKSWKELKKLWEALGDALGVTGTAAVRWAIPHLRLCLQLVTGGDQSRPGRIYLYVLKVRLNLSLQPLVAKRISFS